MPIVQEERRGDGAIRLTLEIRNFDRQDHTAVFFGCVEIIGQEGPVAPAPDQTLILDLLPAGIAGAVVKRLHGRQNNSLSAAGQEM